MGPGPATIFPIKASGRPESARTSRARPALVVVCFQCVLPRTILTRAGVAWYEWWPGPVTSYGFDFECSAGDVVTVNITAESSTSGNAGIINHTTGVSVGAYVQAYADASGTMYPLCQQYAEWVIEGRDQVTANFGTVVFTNPIIQLANGTKASPENGHQDTITYTDGRVAATSTSNSTMVMIKYVL
jgi:hypothetical protein